MQLVNRQCVRCGEQMCYVYQCDPFYGGCGFVDCCDEISGHGCPECGHRLKVKLGCHPAAGGCEYLEKVKTR